MYLLRSLREELRSLEKCHEAGRAGPGYRCTLNPQQGEGRGGCGQALCRDSRPPPQTRKNKHATQGTRSFGQAGRSVFQLLGSRHTGSWKDSLENSQTGGHRTAPGEAVAPPPENDTRWFFVFLQLNWKDKIKQTTSRESARWLQSCRESSTETSRV